MSEIAKTLRASLLSCWVTTGRRVSSAAYSTLVLAIGLDEKLLRRLNEPDDAKAASTRRRGTDAKWKLDPKDVLANVLETLAQVW